MIKSRKLTSALALVALVISLFGPSVTSAQAARDTSILPLDNSVSMLLDGADEDDPSGDHEDSNEAEDSDEDEGGAASGSASIIGSIGIASAAVVALAFFSQSASEIVEKIRSLGKKE